VTPDGVAPDSANQGGVTPTGATQGGVTPAGDGARNTARALGSSAVNYGADGLVPAIVQDASDGRVLMLGWQDAEALAATVATGDVHFHSRSRNRLWRKGETSGNTLRLVHGQLDCDADAILLLVEPAGPTCHTGARSCFDAEAGAREPDARAGTDPGSQGFAWLETLWATIADRAAVRPAGSYTAALIGGGVDVVSRKVAEEATEVVLAAKDDATMEASLPPGARRDQTALAGELADLLYHALVLAAERNVPPRAVIARLRERNRSKGVASPPAAD